VCVKVHFFVAVWCSGRPLAMDHLKMATGKMRNTGAEK